MLESKLNKKKDVHMPTIMKGKKNSVANGANSMFGMLNSSSKGFGMPGRIGTAPDGGIGRPKTAGLMPDGNLQNPTGNRPQTGAVGQPYGGLPVKNSLKRFAPAAMGRAVSAGFS
jgi:hypothetical protein